jgi:hypothetical protein
VLIHCFSEQKKLLLLSSPLLQSNRRGWKLENGHRGHGHHHGGHPSLLAQQQPLVQRPLLDEMRRAAHSLSLNFLDVIIKNLSYFSLDMMRRRPGAAFSLQSTHSVLKNGAT